MFTEKDLFISGHDSVNIYRIPSLITAPGGTLLAFAEARQGDDGDPTDLVLKRSVYEDNQTGSEIINGVLRSFAYTVNWEPLQLVVAGYGEAIMNPCPVVDAKSGRIWLPCYQVFGGLADHLKDSHKGNFLMTWSDDEGCTWAEPQNLNSELPRFIPGPGVSIQMKNGRLIVPGYWSKDAHSHAVSCVIYSDDHGKTWTQGKTVLVDTDESQVIELSDGTLMLNCRSNIGRQCRYVALSDDGGESWYREYHEPALAEPVCQASLIKHDQTNTLLFVNPNSSDRKNLTVKCSKDDGKTWSAGRTIHSGHSAYSGASVLKDGSIGVLYETGNEHAYEKITFARFSIEWVCGGH